MDQEKTYEVELRVLLTPEQQDSLIKRLEVHGARWAGKEKIVDLYYCPHGTTDFSQIAMDAVGSFSLRIRKTEQDGIARVQLNTKSITKHADHHAWEEHEVLVDSFSEAQAIVQLLGYKGFCCIEKERSRFLLDQMTICIDDIHDFGVALEIEIMANRDTAGKAKQAIRSFLYSLGIGEEQILPKSATYLIMQTKRVSF
jgi:adenylate cyclase class 2